MIGVQLDELKITALPTLILVDRRGRVLESWSGQLDEGREKQVIEAISNRTELAKKPGNNLPATVDLFNETKPAHAFNLDSNSSVNIIDVDAQGHIYVQKADQIEKRNVDGHIIENIPIPPEVETGAACAGKDRDFYFILPQKILTSHLDSGARLIKESRLPLPISALNARYDASRNTIFILGKSTTPANASEQILYKFNLSNGELSEVYRAQLPISYNDAIGLGKISYAIGADKLFVSNYHFVGDWVIAPDYGFGKEFHLDFLSPLEPPYYKPSSIKTFELSALRISS